MSANDQLLRLRTAVERGKRPEEAEDLRSIEQRIKLLESYKSLAQTPGVSDLIRWCITEIMGINDRLSTDRKMDFQASLERLAIIEKRDVLLYFIGLFDSSAELESIETMLSEKSEEYESYFKSS